MSTESQPYNRGITRRGFLKGAALGAVVVGAAGSGLTACSPSQGTKPADSNGATQSGGTSTATTTTLNPQDYDYRQNSITDFSKSTLFSEWKLGPLTIKHRMVKSAAFQLAFLRGIPDEYIGYYERMAKGGVDMIWVEDFANIWAVTAGPGMKKDIEAYDVKGLLDALHAAGSHVGYQFDTMGSPLGPMSVSEPFIGNYSTDEVKQWIKDLGDIGKKLQGLGFDAFELNFAANNLGQSFLSRARNNRTDEYGPQSLENRTRFAVEVIKAIKDACGKDFVVQILMNGVEENDTKLGDSSLYTSVEENKAIAKILEKAGVDSLHVRLGPCGQHIAQFANDLYFSARGFEGTTGYGTMFDFSRHYQGKLRANHSGCGMMIDVAAEIKSAVSIPVGAATYMDPAQAPDYFEAALSEGKLDFLVMNRPLCVDTEYVNKLREGRIDEIAPCTRCLHCFFDSDKAGKLMEHCRVAAANWRAYGEDMPEGYNPKPGEGNKKVMVIGGGPAGMEAARIAGMRGYDVTLYEKNGSLGGMLSSAESIKGPHENLSRLATYLAKQQEVNSVKVVTGKEVDADLISAEAPDVIILAVGGVRPPLSLSASGSTTVLGFSDAVGADLGQNVTVLGSNCQAVDMAVYLLSQGKNVTIVTPDPINLFEKGHSVNVRSFVQTAINARGTRIWPQASVVSVGDGTITIKSEAGVEETIACDAVVDVSDMKPNTALIDKLTGVTAIAVGDCKDPWNISEAISAGNLAARNI